MKDEKLIRDLEKAVRVLRGNATDFSTPEHAQGVTSKSFVKLCLDVVALCERAHRALATPAEAQNVSASDTTKPRPLEID